MLMCICNPRPRQTVAGGSLSLLSRQRDTGVVFVGFLSLKKKGGAGGMVQWHLQRTPISGDSRLSSSILMLSVTSKGTCTQ